MNKSNSNSICILGMHRSGTSTITRVINLLGAYLGETNKLIPPQYDNPEGFWEHLEIVDLHERIFSEFSHYHFTTIPLPDKWWQYAEMQPYKKEIKQIIDDNFSNEPLWVWKDPRTCLMLPLWQEVLNELNINVKYIITFRNPLDVALSLKRRNDFSFVHSIALWFLYTIHAIKYTENSDRLFIQYDLLLDNWQDNVFPIVEKLGIPVPFNKEELIKSISSFIKPSLRHSYTSYSELVSHSEIPIPVINLYQLCIKVIQEPEFAFSTDFTQRINHLYSTYISYTNLIGKCNTYSAFIGREKEPKPEVF